MLRTTAANVHSTAHLNHYPFECMALQAAPWPDYRDFTTPLVRDLCWLLSPQFDIAMPRSAYLPFCPSPTATTIAWLHDLDQQLAPLPDAPSSVNFQRLGLYFEALVAYYLKHGPESGVHNIQHNLPLRRAASKGIETLGALDFLFERDGQLQHLEVAVKFYLGLNTENTYQWLGPNTRDSLDRKWQHLTTHQLPLGLRYGDQHPERPTINSRYWLKGILFSPWDSNNAQLMGNDHHWIHLKHAPSYFSHYPGNWTLLLKHRWLGTDYEPQTSLSSAQMPGTLIQHFAHVRQNVMVVREGAVSEQRCFIVNDEWPVNIERFDLHATNTQHR